MPSQNSSLNSEKAVKNPLWILITAMTDQKNWFGARRLQHEKHSNRKNTDLLEKSPYTIYSQSTDNRVDEDLS